MMSRWSVRSVIARMGRRSRFAVSIVLILFAVSCDRSSDGPRREEPPKNENGGREDEHPDVKPGDDNRPGPSDPTIDFVKELNDNVARYSGHGVTMRLDDGGVLVKVFPDGRSEFIDLDGGTRVGFMPGAMREDSICPAATLTVNGKAAEILTAGMRRKSSVAIWYHVTDKDEREHLVVVPAM
ncbi:MAG: hypothetical protein NC411_04240 [Bacteroides sp.]|nr:hypothetical protein [Bacteroides sp.]